MGWSLSGILSSHLTTPESEDGLSVGTARLCFCSQISIRVSAKHFIFKYINGPRAVFGRLGVPLLAARSRGLSLGIVRSYLADNFRAVCGNRKVSYSDTRDHTGPGAAYE